MDRRALLEAGGLTVAAGFGVFVGFPTVIGAEGTPWGHHDVSLRNLDRRAHEVRITATRRSPAGETTVYDATLDLLPAVEVAQSAADREVDGVPVATTTRDVTRVSGVHDLAVSITDGGRASILLTRRVTDPVIEIRDGDPEIGYGV
ncbi:hypothetical protein [Salinirubrum litoreum]|uniref:Tat (Twin-arginine translocation) pathway signal sequence n=1 Tax=Salinirubrum litoreum TaxID=1126234 RepID=A0ABD5R7K0_9EURY|nr:hypothetical protein [Salinirubrum litoreum]